MEQKGLNPSPQAGANVDNQIPDPILPPTALMSPCRAAKRRRTNAGDTAVTSCTPRITTSADLFGSSSPLSSPPTSPEASLLPPHICTNSGLCIHFFRDPGLKAARCANKSKARYQTPTPPAQKPTTTSAIRAAKVLQPYYANSQIDKPDPIGQPQVWADKRQQLCQALPYYNAYQSGAHTSEGYVLGFLCDKEVGKHDKFDDEIIISRIGGGRTQDAAGNFVQSKDQSMNSTYTSFMRSMKEDRPIGVIAGQGNRISPSKLPHYYNVLDWFHITDVWCELNNGCKTWMARFEKINLLERSWWSPQGIEPLTPLSPSTVDGPKAHVACCTACNRGSKLIYNQGWTCLNNDCWEFFQFPNGLIEEYLDYNNDFMKERTRYKGNDPGSLAPPLLTDEDCAKIHAFGIETLFAKGIVCPKAVPIDEAIAGCEIPNSYRPMCHSTIRALTPIVQGQYDVFEYQIPGPSGEIIGFIRHFNSSAVINQQPDGPNELFLQMQTDEFGLKRNPSRNKGSPNEILTSHWAANWGAPYKYGVAQISKGFDQTPIVLIKALKRLTWAGELALTSAAHEGFVPFNELLSIGYFEKSTIGYHDDGEKELGPTVATLSLGCSATMMFRPKAKSGIKGVQKRANARGTQPDVLKVVLKHGDIVIMHGRDIQRFYEHSVVPHGKLRFALTARYVRPELMLPDEQEYALHAGQLPQGSDQYNYTGDLHAMPVTTTRDVEEEIRQCFRIINAKMQLGGIAKGRAVELFSEATHELENS
ncbi:uncharacterized protein BP5553_01586 [Venustampulla echinocandica]|uniref:Fe2OG dioxygenase domain-containing protein n=1 Tax=Venustampulla echinocandica TaxID=2656787 RepID=A0A370U1F7_9HELO|nr:uncharacterized protein BP5553_01586 [Venustampulla echinocandica]RDL41607.1 hypothetical protein BP5553_01586 [Venustampulla echinocandica]